MRARAVADTPGDTPRRSTLEFCSARDRVHAIEYCSYIEDHMAIQLGSVLICCPPSRLFVTSHPQYNPWRWLGFEVPAADLTRVPGSPILLIT